jgi:drug/metabolite transporter superfamily protein YnfA
MWTELLSLNTTSKPPLFLPHLLCYELNECYQAWLYEKVDKAALRKRWIVLIVLASTIIKIAARIFGAFEKLFSGGIYVIQSIFSVYNPSIFNSFRLLGQTISIAVLSIIYIFIDILQIIVKIDDAYFDYKRFVIREKRIAQIHLSHYEKGSINSRDHITEILKAKNHVLLG